MRIMRKKGIKRRKKDLDASRKAKATYPKLCLPFRKK